MLSVCFPMSICFRHSVSFRVNEWIIIVYFIFAMKFIGRNFGSFSLPIACECYFVFRNLLLLFDGCHFRWLFDTIFVYINDVYFQVIIIQSFVAHWRRSIRFTMTRFILLVAMFAVHGIQCRSIWLPTISSDEQSEHLREHIGHELKREKKSIQVCVVHWKFSNWEVRLKRESQYLLRRNQFFFFSLVSISHWFVHHFFFFRKIPPNMNDKLVYQTRCCHRSLKNIDRYQPHQFTQVITTIGSLLYAFQFEFPNHRLWSYHYGAITVLRFFLNTI